MKQCTKCKRLLPATTEFFHRNHTQSSGLHPRCKVCRSEERIVRYENNREFERTQMREYARVHSKEAVERAKLWNKTHPDRAKELDKHYRKIHTDQCRVNVTNRQARLANASGKHTADDILYLFEEQNGKCAYCGIILDKKYHVDHIVPISRGGSNSPDNLAISCAHCNNSKGAKLLSEWIK